MRRTEAPYPFSKLSNEQMAKMNEILHDSKTLSVYPDHSAIKDTNIIGLAGCFVGNGNTYVKSKKEYLEFECDPTYGEMLAASYCIAILPSLLEEYQKYLLTPNHIIVYSDVEVISKAATEDIVKLKRQHHKDIMNEIRLQLADFRFAFPSMNITLEFLGKEKSKNNIFYKASHNAARRIIGKDK